MDALRDIQLKLLPAYAAQGKVGCVGHQAWADATVAAATGLEVRDIAT